MKRVLANIEYMLFDNRVHFFLHAHFSLMSAPGFTGDVKVNDMVCILLIPGIEVLHPLTRDVTLGATGTTVVAPYPNQGGRRRLCPPYRLGHT